MLLDSSYHQNNRRFLLAPLMWKNYATQGKPRARDMSSANPRVNSYCQSVGKKICNHCKGTTQLITECQKWPQHRINHAYHAITNESSLDIVLIDSNSTASISSQPPTTSPLTPELV